MELKKNNIPIPNELTNLKLSLLSKIDNFFTIFQDTSVILLSLL